MTLDEFLSWSAVFKLCAIIIVGAISYALAEAFIIFAQEEEE